MGFRSGARDARAVRTLFADQLYQMIRVSAPARGIKLTPALGAFAFHVET